MPLKIYRLRRLLAVTAALVTLLVLGMYFYARSRATNILNRIPQKIGYDIKQTASGFQFSKSDGKRTLFSIQASDIKQFKFNGIAELHKVSITLYGRDASRFDQIYGDDFAYNQKTGDVTANGDVQIDLVANPTGLAIPDQSMPKELKNPIHLKTRDLSFNRDSGNASTDAAVEFSIPQATGSAVGVKYAGKANTLTLSSKIHVVLAGPRAAIIDADQGVITNDPRVIVLEHPHVKREDGSLQADRVTFHLSPQNQVERVVAVGNVTTETKVASAQPAGKKGKQKNDNATEATPSEMRTRADQAEFIFSDQRDVLRTATLTGNVHLEHTGAESLEANSGRVIVDFGGKNQVRLVHAVDGAHLKQTSSQAAAAPGVTALPSQNFDITAPIIDFTVAQGHILKRAVTSGAAQITVVSFQQGTFAGHQQPAQQKTVVTAGKFDAQFASSDGKPHLASIHGAPNARVVSSTTGQSDRTSTSDSLDATFLPQGGLDSFTQQGNVIYTDGSDPAKRMQAWSNKARYTPTDQMLVLTGDPRVANGNMATTAKTIRINRLTGDAIAEGDVKSTYSELKEQPNGALLASASPIHVTAGSMTVQSKTGVVLYSGNTRLWQDANILQAPTIQFDRDHRSVAAQGTATQPVLTVLVQPRVPKSATGPDQQRADKKKNPSPSASAPIFITAAKLTYADAERKVHYEGGVTAKAADFTATARSTDAYLIARNQAATNQSISGPGQLDHFVAQDNVVIAEPNRRAEGQKLVYTASEEKFVLTGGPPSIFDAEHGKITGVSLTFFRRDDRVLVEGEVSTPVVTTTRMAR